MHTYKHCKTYLPHFQFQFNSGTLENVQITFSKPYINSYECRITETTFGAEITTFEKFQFHIQFKTIELLLWAIQFQFNCEIYPLVQLSSLKLPMDSQCIQASSSKSISVPNVREGFHIYTARQSATLTKISKWCFVWQYGYGCLPSHINI